MKMSCCANRTFTTFTNGCRASLTGTKTVTTPLIPTFPATFTITLMNPSACSALNVVIVDPLPAGLFDPAVPLVISPAGTVDGNTVVVNLGTIAPGATIVTTITGTVALSALLFPLTGVTNTAFVAGSNVCSILTLSTSITIPI